MHLFLQVFHYQTNCFFPSIPMRNKGYVQNLSEPSISILHCFCLTRGSTLTSQHYSPSSVVYVPEPIRAIQQYLPLIEIQSVVMTSFQFIQKKYSIMDWSFIYLISSGVCTMQYPPKGMEINDVNFLVHQPTLIWFFLISAHAILWCLILIWPKYTQFRPDWLC